MPLTYSINVGTQVESLKKQDINSVLLDLPDNTQKMISPKDVRDAFLTSWSSSAFKQTIGNAGIEYIGIDSGNPSDRDIKQKIYIGKRNYAGLDIMNNSLLNDTNKDLDKSLKLALQNPLFKLGEPDKTAGADNTFSSNLRKENNLILIEIKKRAELLKKYNGGFITQDTPQEKANAEKKRKSDLKTFADYKMTGEFGESLQGAKSSFFESLNPEKREAENEVIVAQNKSINEQADAYLRLADSISNYATNAFIGLWNAMEQGASIGEALKMMFIDLVKQIAAAAVKALIFSIVLSFLPTSGAGAAAATVAKSKGDSCCINLSSR